MSRKIEDQMIEAIRAGKNWQSGNTQVVVTSACREVRLHGNLIATVTLLGSGDRWTLAGWNTPTTRSRINALARAFGWPGVNCKGGVPYVYGPKGPSFQQIAPDEWIDAY